MPEVFMKLIEKELDLQNEDANTPVGLVILKHPKQKGYSVDVITTRMACEIIRSYPASSYPSLFDALEDWLHLQEYRRQMQTKRNLERNKGKEK